MSHARLRTARVGAAGFTLIENMVALAIFAVGMMAIVYIMLNGIGLSRTSQSLTQAYVAMQEIVSMMRADHLDEYLYNNVDTLNGANVPPISTVAGQNVATWMQSLKYLPGSGGAAGGVRADRRRAGGGGRAGILSVRCADHDYLGGRTKELCRRDDGRVLGPKAWALR